MPSPTLPKYKKKLVEVLLKIFCRDFITYMVYLWPTINGSCTPCVCATTTRDSNGNFFSTTTSRGIYLLWEIWSVSGIFTTFRFSLDALNSAKAIWRKLNRLRISRPTLMNKYLIGGFNKNYRFFCKCRNLREKNSQKYLSTRFYQHTCRLFAWAVAC